jgi:uncharacterized membrane protein (DUF485 family)
VVQANAPHLNSILNYVFLHFLLELHLLSIFQEQAFQTSPHPSLDSTSFILKIASLVFAIILLHIISHKMAIMAFEKTSQKTFMP